MKEKKMVMLKQISALLDILEDDPELAIGQNSRTIEGRSLLRRRWVEISHILNAVSTDCPTKSPTEWRAFFNDYKHKILKKVKLMKWEQNSAGGGLTKSIPLTPLQERLCNILGWDVKELLIRVPHNPLPPVKNRHAAGEVRTSRKYARNAEAMIEQARATNKLAAAISSLGATIEQANSTLFEAIGRLGDLIRQSDSPIPKKKRRCKITIVTDSESD